jgi:hypothetical protein
MGRGLVVVSNGATWGCPLDWILEGDGVGCMRFHGARHGGPRTGASVPYSRGFDENMLVRGHPSVSLPLLSSPTLPLSICISPTPLHHLQGPHPQSRRLWYSKSDGFPDVDILYPPLLAPQQHPCDTTAPSTSRELMVMGGLEAWCCIGHYIYVL